MLLKDRQEAIKYLNDKIVVLEAIYQDLFNKKGQFGELKNISNQVMKLRSLLNIGNPTKVSARTSV